MSTLKNTFRHISDDLKSSIMKNRGGQEVIARILEAYGFTSRQALCSHLGISQSTMANRYARDTFPADWALLCSIETGVSAEWLASGIDSSEQQNSSNEIPTLQSQESYKQDNAPNPQKFPIEIDINPNKGGKAAIERLVEAYGFTTRQALANHLGVSKSTLANRYMRDTFPADWIIKCTLETGISLAWLSSGIGNKVKDAQVNTTAVSTQILTEGYLIDSESLVFDKSLLPTNLKDIGCVINNDKTYIVDKNTTEITDGDWVINIEGIVQIRKITRIPVGKVEVASETTRFICDIDHIQVIAKCRSVFIKEV